MAQIASLIRATERYLEHGSLNRFAEAVASHSQPDAAVRRSATGLVLLAASLNPIYANDEAIQILAYPDDPEQITALDTFLERKVQSLLAAHESADRGFVTEFQSGRRLYRCRALPLNSRQAAGSPDCPAMVLLVERTSRNHVDSAQVAERYGLTPRERETLHYVIYGLTNKEIGRRMKVSPHTVKAFLKLVMMKMGVHNRAGAIRKALEFRG